VDAGQLLVTFGRSKDLSSKMDKPKPGMVIEKICRMSLMIKFYQCTKTFMKSFKTFLLHLLFGIPLKWWLI
jgi:hypothetical protein